MTTGDIDETSSSPGAGAPPPSPIVIWNDAAGRKMGLPTNEQVTEERLHDLFASVGVTAELHATSSEEEAVELVRAAAAGTRPIVAAGGDGTLRVVASTLLEVGGSDPHRVPAMGILPLGSVMNMARSVDIPRDLDEAVAVIAGGRERVVDVGEIEGWGLFFEGVAIGMHAELFAAAAGLDTGDPRAPLRLVRIALRYRPSRITLELGDGRTIRTRALVATVSNGPYLGLAFAVAPSARLDDGLLDIRVFERFSRWELVRHLWSIARGRRRYEPRVRTIRTTSVRVTSGRPLAVRADGEDTGVTPVEIRIRPAALRLIVP